MIKKEENACFISNQNCMTAFKVKMQNIPKTVNKYRLLDLVYTKLLFKFSILVVSYQKICHIINPLSKKSDNKSKKINLIMPFIIPI